jgi:predicted nucleotidyltransferase
MSRGAIQTAIDDVCDALKESFGEELLSIYLYGSLANGSYQQDVSDINLLVVLKENIDLQRFRQAMHQVWSNHYRLLKKLPILTNPGTLKRHLYLNPLFADHLTKHGQLLLGNPGLPGATPIFPIENVARHIKMALYASACLAPMLLSEKEFHEVDRALQRLTRQLEIPYVDEELTIAQQFAKSFERIQQEIDSYTPEKWSTEEILVPPPLINSLVAIYEYENKLLLVMSESESQRLTAEILNVDWAGVANRIGDEYRNLEITTPSQLQLWLLYESPADYYLENLIHVWGSDPIENLEPEKWRVYRHLGRLPSNLQLIELPHAYVNASEAELAMLVHDFQNKLLNIRLRSELLCRLEGTELQLPPESLPDRHADHEEGIRAINLHLDWWANYYTDLQRSSSE